MAITINDATADKVLDCLFNGAAGVNFNSGTIHIRTGAAPGATAAATGTVLATIALPADAFGAPSGRTVSKAGTWEDTSADATGTAGHWRMTDASSTYVIEGTVTATGGGGDMELNSTSVSTGLAVTITSFSYTL
jgi:hypothetical protein